MNLPMQGYPLDPLIASQLLSDRHQGVVYPGQHHHVLRYIEKTREARYWLIDARPALSSSTARSQSAHSFGEAHRRVLSHFASEAQQIWERR